MLGAGEQKVNARQPGFLPERSQNGSPAQKKCLQPIDNNLIYCVRYHVVEDRILVAPAYSRRSSFRELTMTAKPFRMNSYRRNSAFWPRSAPPRSITSLE